MSNLKTKEKKASKKTSSSNWKYFSGNRWQNTKIVLLPSNIFLGFSLRSENNFVIFCYLFLIWLFRLDPHAEIFHFSCFRFWLEIATDTYSTVYSKCTNHIMLVPTFRLASLMPKLALFRMQTQNKLFNVIYIIYRMIESYWMSVSA